MLTILGLIMILTKGHFFRLQMKDNPRNSGSTRVKGNNYTSGILHIQDFFLSLYSVATDLDVLISDRSWPK